MAKRITVIGSANTDFPILCPRMPEAGESLLVERQPYRVGGKGINQAVACARQGIATAFIGTVGCDGEGDVLLDFLRSEKVDVTAVARAQELFTGMAVLLMEQSTNRILSIPSANHRPLDVGALKGILSASDFVLAQLEVHLPTLFEAMRSSAGATNIILNPAPASPIPADIYPALYCITPNETEAEILTGIAIKTPKDAASAAKALRDKGAARVVITLGAQGVYAITDDGEVHLGAHDVALKDTVGAGDAFNGALAAALCLGMAFEQALRYANAAAALSVSREGSAQSVPTRDEVEAFLQA